VHGALLRAGDALVADLGLTSARWQVMGAIALAAQAPTAPQMGLRMGLTRQGVQKQLDELRANGLVEAKPNPAHRRSPTYILTDAGRRLYARLSERQGRWAAELAAGERATWEATAFQLEELTARLEAAAARTR
jgi:DNA-binding MarR family transcriptional regulator